MKTSKPNRLAILGAKDGQFPKRVITMLEIMRELEFITIYSWESLIEDWIQKTNGQMPGKLISKGELAIIASKTERLVKETLLDLGWMEATKRAVFLMSLRREEFKAIATYERVNIALHELKLAIQGELYRRKFVMIDEQKSDYFEKPELFGLAVKKAVSAETSKEIVAAGNSFAVGLNTASAFHSLRVAELGMRGLAVRLDLKFFRDKGKIQVGVDGATWDELITQTKIKVESEKKLPVAKRKIRKHFKEYERLASQFDRMKNDRNRVMHMRVDVSEPEAEAILLRAKDFLQELVKRKIPLK